MAVPQSVEIDIGQTGLNRKAFELLREGAGAASAAIIFRANQIVSIFSEPEFQSGFRLIGFMCSQGLNGEGGEGDSAPPRSRFWRFEAQPFFRLFQRVTNRNCSRLQVHIGPAQCEDLTAPQACCDSQKHRNVNGRSLRSPQQLRGIRLIDNLDILPLRPGRLDAICRVPAYQRGFVHYRTLKRALEHTVMM